MIAPLNAAHIDRAVQAALEEDVGPSRDDVTTRTIVDPSMRAAAELIARAPGVLAGLEVTKHTFLVLDPEAQIQPRIADGDWMRKHQVIATVSGRLSALLSAERVALNFLQRLSGIATITRRYVEALRPYRARLLDTRKTTPGLRALERYAVRAGGGSNHRWGLWDAILIKENHVVAAGGVSAAIARARAAGLPVEVEVDTLDQLDEALAAQAEIILLDNMEPELVRAAVERTAGRAQLEASGGMTIERAVACAQAGVDRISVGALTHSAPALDIALDVTRTWS